MFAQFNNTALPQVECLQRHIARTKSLKIVQRPTIPAIRHLATVRRQLWSAAGMDLRLHSRPTPLAGHTLGRHQVAYLAEPGQSGLMKESKPRVV
jgi:hypothetical protein